MDRPVSAKARSIVEFREALNELWETKWESLVGIVGFVVTMVTTALPLWVMILLGLFAIVLTGDVIREWRRCVFVTREKHLPLVVDVARFSADLRVPEHKVLGIMKKHGFSPDRYHRYGIEHQDWCIVQETYLSQDGQTWSQLANLVLRRIDKLEQLRGHKEYHLFLKCPAVLALGIGGLMGTLHRLTLYHYEGQDYVALMRFTEQALLELKRKPAVPLRHVSLEWPTVQADAVYVGLDLATQTTTAFVSEAQAAGAVAVLVGNTYGGRLSLDADWIDVAREAAHVLLEIIRRTGATQMHLAITAPVALAAAIGMGVGTQGPIRVYHWFNEQRVYVPVLDLNRMHSRP